MSSIGNKQMYGFLVIVIVLAAGAIVALTLLRPNDAIDPEVKIIGSNGNSVNVSLSEMIDLPAITRQGSFQNSYGNIRGNGEYTGVNISILLALVGGMIETDVLIVTAADGYAQTFTYSNVYPSAIEYAYQGDMVLAYEFNESIIPYYTDGPRLMFLPEDGYYSNDDANMTIDPEYFTGGAGPKLVTNVEQLRVVSHGVLQVSVGSATSGFTMDDILAMPFVEGEGGFKNRFGTLNGPYVLKGVSLLSLLQSVGDLPSNYTLTVIASDGYTTEFNLTVVNGHIAGYNATTGNPVGQVSCTSILAYEKDGAPLDSDFGAPFRIAFLNAEGHLTDSYLWARWVAKLVLTAAE
ncbi:MAG: hypothetical protein ACFFAY_10850 [Promethearchaeota archaeon]